MESRLIYESQIVFDFRILGTRVPKYGPLHRLFELLANKNCDHDLL